MSLQYSRNTTVRIPSKETNIQKVEKFKRRDVTSFPVVLIFIIKLWFWLTACWASLVLILFWWTLNISFSHVVKLTRSVCGKVMSCSDLIWEKMDRKRQRHVSGLQKENCETWTLNLLFSPSSDTRWTLVWRAWSCVTVQAKLNTKSSWKTRLGL